MNNFRKNKSISTSTSKLIISKKPNNKKSLSTNKTSILYLNDIPDINFMKHNNYKYFYKKPEFYNDSNIQKQIDFLVTNIKNKDKFITIKNESISSLKKIPKLNSFDGFKIRNLTELKKTKTIENYDLPFNGINKNNNNTKFPKISIIPSSSNYLKQKNNNLDYLYRSIFSKSILFKPKPRYIDNKLNLLYSENESQYQLLMEKRSKIMNEKGFFLRFDEDSEKIKERVNVIKTKIKFMKNIMDYSYPSFMLTKIKIWGKELKKNKTEEKLTPFEEQKNIIKNRNILRTKYLQKNLKVFPVIS